jgi:hypothetical protein
MEVIGVLCLSLGSSTVQLHDSLGIRRACACSEAGFSSKNGDRALGVYYGRAASYCAFFSCGPNDIHKEMLLFLVRSVCRVKRFTTGSRNYLKDVGKSQMIPDEVRK